MEVDRSIWAQGLTREFAGVNAVDRVDLSIGSGRVFGFLGPNGSGKTTTVRMLTTILKPTAGSARVAGFDVSKEQGEVRERVGVALQDVGLDGLMTAREMLVLQARLFRADREQAVAAGRKTVRTTRVRRQNDGPLPRGSVATRRVRRHRTSRDRLLRQEHDRHTPRPGQGVGL